MRTVKSYITKNAKVCIAKKQKFTPRKERRKYALVHSDHASKNGSAYGAIYPLWVADLCESYTAHFPWQLFQKAEISPWTLFAFITNKSSTKEAPQIFPFVPLQSKDKQYGVRHCLFLLKMRQNAPKSKLKFSFCLV